MAKIVPFNGLRYSKALKAAISRLVTPPYDIISEQEQKRFYRAHPQNIIRLEYGTTKPTDTAKNNRYTRAKKTLQEWLSAKVLGPESKPAFYLLQTEYVDPDGEKKKFTGLFSRVKLERFGEGKVLPHEKTYEGPKTDRFNLLKETGVSMSPVFSLYRDPSQRIRALFDKLVGKQPELKLEDWSGSQHKLWVITQPTQIAAIQNAFQGKKLLIADGHHRYLTAIRYQKEFRDQIGPDADWVMMCVAEIHDPGLSILPVYRLIKGISQKQWSVFKKKCEEYFEIEKVTAVKQLREAQMAAVKKYRCAVIGYIEKGGKNAYLMRVKQGYLESFYNPSETRHSRIYHRLDVVILNQLILNQLLDIHSGEEKGRVTYTKNLKDAQQTVERGEAQAAFLPGLPNVDAIWDLAKQGETMPQKSTYFLPKLITGLVMNPMNKDVDAS
jgi:uncharacterized protein (DUF1015 family)